MAEGGTGSCARVVSWSQLGLYESSQAFNDSRVQLQLTRCISLPENETGPTWSGLFWVWDRCEADGAVAGFRKGTCRRTSDTV
ncbi:hypothetical protein Nmel_012723 [Mimus melanotis]